MKEKINIALFDSSVKEAEPFINGLEDITGKHWEPKVLRANQGRKNKFINFLRYVKYFLFPLWIFLNRKKYDCIIGWQAFYGLLFAFYCRLFNVKKSNKVVVKNLIYKPKKGTIGKIYFAFMKYVIRSKYIDVFICSAERYCDQCANIFEVPREKFCYIPFGVDDFTKVVDMSNIANDYVLALGRSNRDWDFLIDSLRDVEYPVRIVCDELHREDLPSHIRIYNNVWQEESYCFIRDCKCMVIPIKDGDIVAGETVLIQAMAFSKPIIITEPSCLADDYVTNGETGIVVPKEKEALQAAVKRLYEEAEFSERIAKNSRRRYEEKHSLLSFGKSVGQVLVNNGFVREIVDRNG